MAVISDLFGGNLAQICPRMPDAWRGFADFSGVQDARQRPVFRWRLARLWGPGERRVAFLGCNPSTAGAEAGDPTVARLIHFAFAWGFDGFELVNFVPLIASKPSECAHWLLRHNAPADEGAALLALEAVRNNLQVVREVGARAELLVVAYGEIATMVPRLVKREVLEAFAGAGVSGRAARPLHAFGRTKGGAPIHPMARGRHRVRDFSPAIEYDRGGWLWYEED